VASKPQISRIIYVVKLHLLRLVINISHENSKRFVFFLIFFSKRFKFFKNKNPNLTSTHMKLKHMKIPAPKNHITNIFKYAFLRSFCNTTTFINAPSSVKKSNQTNTKSKDEKKTTIIY